ncbi:MAG TPA: hypothetical protein VFX97_01540 [Pyrinomonadaceae bacterium]|nr:hypothetical protein [Pyrinomonadaceae bacterium]
MDRTTQRKRGGYKRSQIKKPLVKTPSLHSYAITPELLVSLPPLSQIEPTNPLTFQFGPVVPPPQPQKSLGDLISELIWEMAKAAWKQTNPASYNFNQVMFELAPYWPPESRWMLGVGAVGSAVYGLGQVADRIDKAIDWDRNRR